MSTVCATFDVWGQLLRRRVEPDEVKLFACWAFSLVHADKIHKEWRDARQLLGARQAIEQELAERSRRNGRGGYFRLREVLERLLTRTCAMDHLAPETMHSSVQKLVQIELEQERFVTFPNPMAKPLLEQQAGKRLAFLADDRLEADDLARLLRFNGLAECAGRGLTTADLEAGELAGTLFEVAARKLDLRPGGWQHFGDPDAAERLGARNAGAVALVPWEPTDAVGPLSQPETWEPTAFLPLPGRLDEAVEEALADSRDASAREMVQLGVEASPLFTGFALWILEQALRNKSEHIYFFTREGQFLWAVYDAVMRAFDSNVTSPPCSILSVSRLSTFAPSLDELSPKNFSDVWAVYNPQSVLGFFATLGIEALCDVDELAMFGLSLDERIEAPARDPRLSALLAHTPFRERVMPRIGAMRRLLMDYLASEGLTPAKRRVSTVDVGWHGSIQSNLARILPETHFQGLYLGLEKRKSQTGPNVSKSAYVADLRQSMRHADLVTYVAPMEFLCGAAYGSTVRYEAGEPPKPIRMPVDQETQDAFANVVAPFQAGVIAGARKWAHELRAHGLGSKDVLAQAVTTWERLIHSPTERIAHGFAETTIDETFGFGRTFRLPRQLGPGTPANGCADQTSVSTIVQDAVRSIPWPQAFAHYASSNRVIKLIVPAAIRAGKRGRRLQSQIRDVLERKKSDG